MSLPLRQQFKTKSKWVLWGHLPNNIEHNWELSSYHRLATFDNLVDLYGYTECIKQSKALSDLTGCALLFFMKEGIEPRWECPQVYNGGGFSFRLDGVNTSSFSNKTELQLMHKYLDVALYLMNDELVNKNKHVLTTIGADFSVLTDHMLGLTYSPKKATTNKAVAIIKVWLNTPKYQTPSLISNPILAQSKTVIFETYNKALDKHSKPADKEIKTDTSTRTHSGGSNSSNRRIPYKRTT